MKFVHGYPEDSEFLAEDPVALATRVSGVPRHVLLEAERKFGLDLPQPTETPHQGRAARRTPSRGEAQKQPR